MPEHIYFELTGFGKGGMEHPGFSLEVHYLPTTLLLQSLRTVTFMFLLAVNIV
jgi:hypothetical protein